MEETNQSLIQKKIALANSEHSAVIIELLKDCMAHKPIIGKTEFETLVNAITLEVQGNMLKAIVDYLDYIKKGGLHEPK